MFNRRPTSSKYDSTWDTDIVLSYLKVEPIVQFKKLTLKLVILIALATAQRSQTLHLLDMNMLFKKNSVTFTFDELLKHEKPGQPRVPVTIQTSKCTELCVVNTLNSCDKERPDKAFSELYKATLTGHESYAQKMDPSNND